MVWRAMVATVAAIAMVATGAMGADVLAAGHMDCRSLSQLAIQAFPIGSC